MSTSYQAPLHDMLFAMREVGGLSTIQASRDDFDDELVEAILGEAARFASEVLAPTNRSGDVQGCRWDGGQVATADGFRAAFDAFRDAGWFAMPSPAELGGQSAPTLVSTAVLEMWKSANLAFSLCQMLTLGAVEAIRRHASPELCRRYLEPMAAGRWTGTMNLTEPQAGSDLAAIRTRAVPEGDHYRITGTKIFITWGEHDMAENIVHLVLARLPDAAPGVKGISLFLCPKFLVEDDGRLGARNDLVCASIEHKLGIHGSATAVMSFGEGDGAIGWLVGEAGQGLACMFTMMNHARLNVGLEGVAIAERAYQQARGYALERVQGRTLGRAEGEASTGIVGHPDVRRMLMDMKSRTEAMRALAYYAAGQMDLAHGGADTDAAAMVDLLIPVVKGWCTESALAVTSAAIQVHGGMGYVEETGVAQHFRDARITTIYEGTTAIQANDLIGRKIRRDRGATLQRLLAAMRADAATIAAHPDPLLQRIAGSLAAGVAELERAGAWLLDADEREAAAGAVAFLQLTGTVTAGWLMARAAEAATAQLGSGGDDWLAAKRATALHYAVHTLPQAAAWALSAVDGAVSTLALHDGQF